MEDGFAQMSRGTFFNLASQFDLPVDIVSLLEKQTDSDNRPLAREDILTQMRLLRLKHLNKASGLAGKNLNRTLSCTRRLR